MKYLPKTRKEKMQYALYGCFVPSGLLNHVRFSPSETLSHILGKTILAYELRQKGVNFLCEAYFEGGKFDIVDTVNKIAYEIVNSSNPPRLNLPKQIKDCIVVFVGDTDTIDTIIEKVKKF